MYFIVKRKKKDEKYSNPFIPKHNATKCLSEYTELNKKRKQATLTIQKCLPSPQLQSQA